MQHPIDVTVATVVEERGRFLIVEELATGKVVLNQPAGHVETGEQPLAAIVRETFEETGHIFDPTSIVGIYTWTVPDSGLSILRICFTGVVSAPVGAVTLDTGIIATHWMTRAELVQRGAQLRSPLVLAAVDDYLAGCRYPLGCLRAVGDTSTEVKRAARA
jgi:8-oxo-dGTP pyrophosphatase MutT (NUDIX family)